MGDEDGDEDEDGDRMITQVASDKPARCSSRQNGGERISRRTSMSEKVNVLTEQEQFAKIDKRIIALEANATARLEAANSFETQVRLEARLEEIIRLLRVQCGKATVAASASPTSDLQACREKLTDAEEANRTPIRSERYAVSPRKNFVEPTKPSSSEKHIAPIPE